MIKRTFSGSVISDLPDPPHQFPGIITFYGKRFMQNALRALFLRNKFRRSSDRSLLNLRVDIGFEGQENPVLFADGDLAGVESSCSSRTCHFSRTLSTSWDSMKAYNIGFSLHARLAWFFVDVICIFAEDYGGLSGTIDLISKLVECGSASTLPRQVRPSLVIATASSRTVSNGCIDAGRTQAAFD